MTSQRNARKRVIATGVGAGLLLGGASGLALTLPSGAFAQDDTPATTEAPAEGRRGGPMTGMLDELVAVGWLAPADRPGAEAGPWAAVHGLALLLVDGPLKDLTPAEREDAIERTLELMTRGLATGPEASVAR